MKPENYMPVQPNSALRRGAVTALRILLPLLLIACYVTIFGHSMQNGETSSGLSTQVTAFLNRLFVRMHIGIELEALFVRKLAHFLEYTLLGFLLMLCTRVYTGRILGHISWPLFLGLLTALLDECLQLLIPGRTGLLTDVALDFGGVLFGVVVGLFVLLVGKQFWSEVHSMKKKK